MSIFSTILKIHQSMYEKTDGRLGHKLLGVPTLLLRTAGRKIGRSLSCASFQSRNEKEQSLFSRSLKLTKCGEDNDIRCKTLDWRR